MSNVKIMAITISTYAVTKTKIAIIGAELMITVTTILALITIIGKK